MAEAGMSGFKFYSLGIVTVNKPRDSDFIEVDPIEEFSLDSGSLAPDSKKYNVSMPNQHGVSKGGKLSGGSVIKAKWVPFGHSNRETPPDVVAGETVMIFSFADTQDYYWTTMMREPSLRRKEHVVYVFSNQPAPGPIYDLDTSYWLEVSTVEKRVRLHTSDNDGEACQYEIEINTKDGQFSLTDNIGNSLVLDSVGGKLSATTTADIEFNTQKFVVNAGTEFTVNTTSSTINASSHTENAAASVTGGMAVSGGGGATVSGGFNVEGDITASGSIIDGGGNTSNHSH